MSRRSIRRIAILVLGLLAFAQAGMTLAECSMDRGSMAQAMTMPADEPCDCCPTEGASVTAVCVAHCTADLQLTGAAPDIAATPAVQGSAALPIARFRSEPVLAYLPPGTLPRRILLHSFQV
jgi:hypothetical protein